MKCLQHVSLHSSGKLKVKRSTHDGIIWVFLSCCQKVPSFDAKVFQICNALQTILEILQGLLFGLFLLGLFITVQLGFKLAVELNDGGKVGECVSHLHANGTISIQ